MSPTERDLGMLGLFKRGSLIIGIPFLIAGFFLLGRTALYLKTALKTDARVIRIEQEFSSSSNGRHSHRVYKPTFEFLDASGNLRNAATRYFSTDYKFNVGEHVEILYLPEGSGIAQVATFFDEWGTSLIISGLGAGTCTFSAITGIAMANLRKRHEDTQRPK